jgi:hypothetical protein
LPLFGLTADGCAGLPDWLRRKLHNAAQVAVCWHKGPDRLELYVVQDPIGRWWAGSSWSTGPVGHAVPIDSFVGPTREAALAGAAADVLRSLPGNVDGPTGGKIAALLAPYLQVETHA